MTVLYKLAKEQLSKQHHYDFGLRALKSVLVMAGELKRGSPDLAEVHLTLAKLHPSSCIFTFRGMGTVCSVNPRDVMRIPFKS